MSANSHTRFKQAMMDLSNATKQLLQNAFPMLRDDPIGLLNVS
ncbi:hypothetical protein QTP81_07130 [Alteromonas sp. ASW11-36]|uniref:Uncharacterized protein n=1 Tax=Alteromonas arenosi TaxID=3055817 RepID=A0ABT7SVZ2_9ALTE|nr:hypothetical protein [Alteromonas sp. ASW11-36]MDM7860364.1 hypothetical protein [Alteromonas sp. ASW11-36]